MRTPMNNISPLILYWSIIYVLALLSLYTYVAGILVGNRNSTKTPANKSDAASQKPLWIQPSTPSDGVT